ncbi:MAG: hypothetical protein EAX95_06430 [Candidatus Thorarchaeota archaeon]|nr:hypothetical protein [Candidatus Thorarchaeota archaeon]
MVEYSKISISVDDAELPAILGRPVQSCEWGVVILHPHPLFGGDMENHVVRFLEGIFLEMGYTTLRFDFRGAGVLANQYEGLAGSLFDALAAYDVLDTISTVDKIGVAGYSYGGSIAFRLAAIKPAKFLIALSASRNLVTEVESQGLNDVTCPALLMHGGKDLTIPVRDLYELAALLQGAHPTVIELANENHFYGNLKEAGDEIRTFLRSL